MDATAATLIYKLVSLISGAFICFLGYRLFTLGVFTAAGDLDAAFKDTKVVLKRAAPGTFFALFGAAVIGVTVWRGIEFYTTTQAGASAPITSVTDNRLKLKSVDTAKVIGALRSGSKLPEADLNEFLNYLHTLELKEKGTESLILGDNYNPDLYQFDLRKKTS
jgi:hypothetical protein